VSDAANSRQLQASTHIHTRSLSFHLNELLLHYNDRKLGFKPKFKLDPQIRFQLWF